MPKLPDFQSEEELIHWFDTTDTADYMDEMPLVEPPFNVILTEWTTSPVDLRLSTETFHAIEQLADRRGIPYQRLIQTWLKEKLTQEAPDLLPQH